MYKKERGRNKSIANDVDIIIQKRNGKVEELQKHKQHIREIYADIERLEEQRNRMLRNSENKLPLNQAVWDSIQQLDTNAY